MNDKSISLKKLSVLDRNSIKYILIVLMTLDHMALFMSSDNPLVFPYVFLSRIVAPIMAYFLAEGYFYTRSVGKYLARLGIFAFISDFAFSYFFTGSPIPVTVYSGEHIRGISIYLSGLDLTVAFSGKSVIYTLFLGLLSIVILDSKRISVFLKVLLCAIIIWLSSFGDWGYWNILFCILFYAFRKRNTLLWGSFLLVALSYIFGIRLFANPFYPAFEMDFHPAKLGILLVPFIICLLYNGNPGNKTKFNQYFFYFYYPLHIVIIRLIFTF